VLLDADRHVGVHGEQGGAREAEVVDGLELPVEVRVGVRVKVRVRVGVGVRVKVGVRVGVGVSVRVRVSGSGYLSNHMCRLITGIPSSSSTCRR
jgi:hypothetical protein